MRSSTSVPNTFWPATTARNAGAMVATSCLTRYPFAPMRNALTMYSSSEKVVKNTMRASSWVPRMSSAASRPPMPGIWMSISSTSGRSRS